MVQKKSGARKTPAQRNRDLEREAAARGIEPLTGEALASLALGTKAEGEELLEVAGAVRRRSRARRRTS